MLLCLVTDRRRLAPGAASAAAERQCLLEQARYAVAARIDLIQLRERDLSAADLTSLAIDLMRITAGSPTRLVINDRVDVALASGAGGVHLRGDSIPVSAARLLAPSGFLIGRSVHTVSEAAAAADADYLIAGTVFSSVSKEPAAPLIGLDGLASIARSVTVPVLAIGGITVGRAGELALSGVSGLAAIGLFLGPEHARPKLCRAEPVSEMADALRRQFDSRRAAS
jgi:thiamine-phosphate diphosphorylase